MPIRDVVMFGDRRLQRVASAVDYADRGWRQDAADLAETLEDLKARLGFGNALAAQQIGSAHRLIAFNGLLGCFVAMNPEITWRSEEMFPVWDDCFSLPGACVAVMRHQSIRFDYTDLEGKQHSRLLEGSPSQLVQHEVDHLDGILMSDRMVAPGSIIAREMSASTPHPGAAR